MEARLFKAELGKTGTGGGGTSTFSTNEGHVMAAVAGRAPGRGSTSFEGSGG